MSNSGFGSRMTRRVSFIAATALAGSLLTVLAPASPGSAAATGPSTHRWVLNTMQRMTLEEKVGQLFVTHVYGETADTTVPADVAANRARYGVDNGAQVIAKYKPGGIIYFAWTRSVRNPQQIAGLSNGLQKAAADNRLSIPLLITTDQEQGLVARVGPPATQFPGNMALGAGRSATDAATAASITAKELRAIGINQNYAPVADVNVNAQNPVIGVRSFSEDPELAAQLTAAQVSGYQSENLAATGKHFPGHGDTSVDSHTGIPLINHTRDEWERLDKPPFQAAVDRGIDSIMTAHLIVPALDPSRDPATLSHPIMTGILRNEMGYDGVIVTDALDMAGVRGKYGDDRVAVLALKAGVDQLLMPPDFPLAYNSVIAAVRSGEISRQRIDESVYRVLRLKHKRGLVANPYVDESLVSSKVGTAAHYAAAQQITDKTPTLIKNGAELLPLTADSGKSVLVTGWGVSTTSTLAEKMSARGVAADPFQTGVNPTDAQIAAAVDRANARDLTVVLTNRAWFSGNSGQQKLVKALLDTGKPVIAVAVRDAYDIAYFTGAPTYVATYSYTHVSLESLTKVLFGEVSPTGKLPVTIPVAGSPGTALYPFGHGLSY